MGSMTAVHPAAGGQLVRQLGRAESCSSQCGAVPPRGILHMGLALRGTYTLAGTALRSPLPARLQRGQGGVRGGGLKQRWSPRRRQKTGGVRAYDEGPDVDLMGEVIEEDYYSILGLTPDASPAAIKKAYYNCMKVCHPDLSGNHPASVNFCSFVNEVYEVLSDPEQRMIYDEINGFAVTSANPFLNTSDLPLDQAFVDEFSCIGCKNCTHCAENTFEIEPEHGRARVMNQTVDHPSKVQEAIDTCPVDCIHWVTAPQLSLLEDEMRRMERVNVGMMLSGQGRGGLDVFAQASWRWDKRNARSVAKARAKAARKKSGGGKETAWWEKAPWEMMDDVVNGGYDSDEEKQLRKKSAAERARAAAERARRWRDASRAGKDRRPTLSLPSEADQEAVPR